VDPVPDPVLLRKSGSSENRTRTSESVARNSITINKEINIKINYSNKYKNNLNNNK
jgi:hypothetical protein